MALLLLGFAGPGLVAPGLANGTGGVTGSARVIDGDTVEVMGSRLDLYGIDAPELTQVCRLRGKPYDCGDIARAALLDLTAGAVLVCKRVAAQDGTAICTADDYDIGSGMVYTGWALADPARPARYEDTELGAREAQRGLWRGRFVTPWDWREGKRLEHE